MPDAAPAIRPPQIPSPIEMITSNGIINAAIILEDEVRFGVDAHVSSASICSLTRILPSSSQFYRPPHRPGQYKTSVGANSSITVSRTICAMVDLGMTDLRAGKPVCTALTAPINTEIMDTMPSEPIPISLHWCISSFQYITVFGPGKHALDHQYVLAKMVKKFIQFWIGVFRWQILKVSGEQI